MESNNMTMNEENKIITKAVTWKCSFVAYIENVGSNLFHRFSKTRRYQFRISCKETKKANHLNKVSQIIECHINNEYENLIEKGNIVCIRELS